MWTPFYSVGESFQADNNWGARLESELDSGCGDTPGSESGAANDSRHDEFHTGPHP